MRMPSIEIKFTDPQLTLLQALVTGEYERIEYDDNPTYWNKVVGLLTAIISATARQVPCRLWAMDHPIIIDLLTTQSEKAAKRGDDAVVNHCVDLIAQINDAYATQIPRIR